MTALAAVESSPLDALAVEIGREVQAAEADFQSAVTHAIRAGELLIEARRQVHHGEWEDWVDANFPGSLRKAQGYMRLARKARSAMRFAHLGIGGALDKLSEPSVGDGRSNRTPTPDPETDTPSEPASGGVENERRAQERQQAQAVDNAPRRPFDEPYRIPPRDPACATPTR
jgi:hypothetical protein